MPNATITYRQDRYHISVTIESDDTNDLIRKVSRAIAQIEHDGGRPDVSLMSAWRQVKRWFRGILVSG